MIDAFILMHIYSANAKLFAFSHNNMPATSFFSLNIFFLSNHYFILCIYFFNFCTRTFLIAHDFLSARFFSSFSLVLIIYLFIEHDLAASTFAARIATSTQTDFYSAITTAIGTLRGPLHGGANEAAMILLSQFSSPDEAEKGVCFPSFALFLLPSPWFSCPGSVIERSRERCVIPSSFLSFPLGLLTTIGTLCDLLHGGILSQFSSPICAFSYLLPSLRYGFYATMENIPFLYPPLISFSLFVIYPFPPF